LVFPFFFSAFVVAFSFPLFFVFRRIFAQSFSAAPILRRAQLGVDCILAEAIL